MYVLMTEAKEVHGKLIKIVWNEFMFSFFLPLSKRNE